MTPVETSHACPDGGFASVTAIILCAALSLACAGLLTLVSAEKNAARRDLFRAQQAEAMNTAMLQFATDLVAAPNNDPLDRSVTVDVPGGQMTVSVHGEFEGRKWPFAKLAELEPALLKQRTRLSKEDLQALAATRADGAALPKDDCVRSLFSDFGEASVTQAPSTGIGIVASGGGHDGQVWRLRAVSGGRLEERQVRFLGDRNRLFAVVSQEDLASGEMPSCTQLISQP